ncbi:MAG: hypothetical protein V3T70_07980 [Phycisphaerae bacterium]
MSSESGPRLGPSTEHFKALDTIRRARNVLILVTVLAPLTHLGAWVAVQFCDVLRPTEPGVAAVVTTQEAGDVIQSEELSAASKWNWHAALGAGLLAAEFVGRCGVFLLFGTMVLGVLVTLTGRLSGTGDMIAAMYLAILVGAVFVPWERMAPESIQVYGVFTTLEKLEQHDDVVKSLTATPAAFAEEGAMGVSEYQWNVGLDALRFGAGPLLASILLLMCSGRFGRGYRAARGTPGT